MFFAMKNKKKMLVAAGACVPFCPSTLSAALPNASAPRLPSTCYSVTSKPCQASISRYQGINMEKVWVRLDRTELHCLKLSSIFKLSYKQKYNSISTTFFRTNKRNNSFTGFLEKLATSARRFSTSVLRQGPVDTSGGL